MDRRAAIQIGVGGVMRIKTALFAMAVVVALSGCATVHNLPLNEPAAQPFTGLAAPAAANQKKNAGRDDAVIGLAFSGGGTRAAAFAYGVLDRMARAQPAKGGQRGDMLDRISVVSGVSGGSIMAAYYGLKGRAALADFRQQFLTQDLMSALDTNVSLVNINRALGGGANTDDRLRNWLNAHLFHDATFAALAGRRPVTLINATDIYNRTPFLFAPQSFAAACSDITKYPIAAAVAASAAVPAAFAPVVIETYPGQCQTPLPDWVRKAADDREASPLLHSYAKGLKDIRDGHMKYVKLFDGGLIDNYGLSSITIIRAGQSTPYGPLPPEDAVKLRRLLFLVVDAGQGPQGDWSKTLEGPAGKELIGAVVDVLVDANARASYTAFEATMKNWRNDIVRWRCGLKPAEVARLRGGAGRWNCNDLKITIARISFNQLDAERAKRLNKVPTTFTLPAETVDDVALAGGDALEANAAYKAFLKEL